uniref:Uncharacterized protein n=1 Tax=Oryza barthii TaxID=65489 RepID=A0A0D3G931_9ORYZ
MGVFKMPERSDKIYSGRGASPRPSCREDGGQVDDGREKHRRVDAHRQCDRDAPVSPPSSGPHDQGSRGNRRGDGDGDGATRRPACVRFKGAATRD